MKRFVTCCTLLLVCSAHNAWAQGGIYLSPFVGTTLTSPSETGSSTKPGFGAALGSSISSFFSAETEFAYFPEILDNSAEHLSQNKVVTFGANTTIGPRIGPVKVYGAFGGGGLYLNVKSVSSLVTPNPESVSSTYFALNFGGGAIAFLGDHFAVRGDLRYFKAYGFKTSDIETTGALTLDKFDFWRAAVGIVLH